MLENKQKLFPLNEGAFLITDKDNVYYLTGFKGSFGWALACDENITLITDGRYTEKANKLAKVRGFAVQDIKNIKEITKNMEGKLVVEDSVSLALHKKMKKIFKNAKVSVMKENPVLKARLVKSDKEIEKIKVAQAQTDKVIGDFWGCLKAGMTEREAAWELELRLRDKGKFGLAFAPIVAFGQNTSLPHHTPSETILEKGDPILIDCGATFQNYASDMTRCGLFGENKEYEKLYNAVLKAQEKTLKSISKVKTYKALSAFCRKEMGDCEKYFTHSLGHGVGLNVHESPSISIKSKEKIVAGQVVTIEPGAYISGKFGVRIEDLVLVKKNEIEILSKSSKKLVKIAL